MMVHRARMPLQVGGPIPLELDETQSFLAERLGVPATCRQAGLVCWCGWCETPQEAARRAARTQRRAARWRLLRRRWLLGLRLPLPLPPTRAVVLPASIVKVSSL